MAWCQTRKNKKQVLFLRMAADALEQITNFATLAAAALFKAKEANSSNNKTMKRTRNNNVPMIPIIPNNELVKVNGKKRKRNVESHNQVITLRSKTIAVPNSKPVKRNTLKKKRVEKVEDERLTVAFVDTMYENMWKFVNLDTIKFILRKAGCKTKITHKDDVWDDDNWTREFYNSICQKGPEEEGHYVYVNKDGEVLGTYEGNMIDSGDDGICHGAAMAAALNDCGHDIGPLKMNPTPEEKTTNYKTIMNLYKYIIKQGWWNEAIRTFFYDEVHWVDNEETQAKETNIALKTLNKTRF